MLTKNEIKHIQSLTQKKARAEHGQFIAEGPKLLQDLLQECPEGIVSLYTTQSEALPNIPTGVELRQIEPFELEKISALQTPQQVLAVVKTRPNTFLPFTPVKWALMLDGIQDPGNMGSIIRIADWFGIQQVYCTPETADCYNPKVVQAAMGSLWRVNICYGDCAGWLSQTQVPVYGTLLEGRNVFDRQPLPPGIVIIGNEGKGISASIKPFITLPLTIPRIGRAESLNAAVATGIVLGSIINA